MYTQWNEKWRGATHKLYMQRLPNCIWENSGAMIPNSIYLWTGDEGDSKFMVSRDVKLWPDAKRRVRDHVEGNRKLAITRMSVAVWTKSKMIAQIRKMDTIWQEKYQGKKSIARVHDIFEPSSHLFKKDAVCVWFLTLLSASWFLSPIPLLPSIHLPRGKIWDQTNVIYGNIIASPAGFWLHQNWVRLTSPFSLGCNDPCNVKLKTWVDLQL